MNTDLYYRATLDSMTPAMLAALIDLSDGVPIIFYDPWTWDGLAKRKLVMPRWDLMDISIAAVKSGMDEWKMMIDNQLTAYGREFLAWYRAPREVPGQLELFLGRRDDETKPYRNPR